MTFELVELANFRKLKSVRVGIADETTVFVGANNSGKTSAIHALRYFLVERERGRFSINDFTLSHWPVIIQMESRLRSQIGTQYYHFWMFGFMSKKGSSFRSEAYPNT